MNLTETVIEHADQGTAASAGSAAELRSIIEHAAHLLPAQGPITVFIHHNTLHAFEDLPFDEAVTRGAQVFGCQPYLSEEVFRAKLAQGRIQAADLAAALREDLGHRAHEPMLRWGSRFDLRRAMLEHTLRTAPPAELRWFIAETEALDRFRGDAPPATRERYLQETRRWIMRDVYSGATSNRERPSGRDQHIRHALDDLFNHFGAASIGQWSEATWEAFTLHALWRICRDGMHGVKSKLAPQKPSVRHRDLLLEATAADSDRLVHDLLIRFCAAFLDQGLAHWQLPQRDEGFWASFLALYRPPGGPPDRWLRALPQEIARLLREDIDPLASIAESLNLLGIAEHDWPEFVSASLLALRGWAGMIHQVETRADRVARPVAEGALVEFLAVRLILERLALAYLASEQLNYHGALRGLREFLRGKVAKPAGPSVDQRAFLVFQLAQLQGWLPQELNELSKAEWSTLADEIEQFSALERRRVFHQAFERRYRIQTLDAFSIRAAQSAPAQRNAKFQVICCLDEREESFRRHLEELAPDVDTLAAPGFFSVAMYYRGAADAHFVPLCPVIIRPEHFVREEAAYVFEESDRRRARTRKAFGAATHQIHVGSRTFAGGALLTAIFGPLASVPLVARILFPRLTARIRRTFGRLMQPPAVTQLRLERTAPSPGPNDDELGFSVPEMARIVERVLCDIGLTKEWSPLVIFAGHGSSSLNNPHESAHDCGACGGGRGGPNARAFARMANDLRVRALLALNGLHLPENTVFVGAYHNTCDESVTYFDLDRLPSTHNALFDEAKSLMDLARARNAHERCRRFETAPLDLSAEDALRHVEARAEDLAQVRPEYGHATNAVAFVGRRSRTRGLYMDRRTFLTSYDPTQDDEQSAILTRILQAAVPVCGGINLEYYFSFVDPTGWGCGTKLPHNITALLGVMDGASSDLRTGLPWQMVEIHDPVRLLFVVETTPEAMLGVMDRNPGIGGMCRNGWVQIATLSPDSNMIHLFRHGRFEPYQPEATELPTARSSVDWYRGWREHLGYALIVPEQPRAEAAAL